jgi:hypothetical protein
MEGLAFSELSTSILPPIQRALPVIIPTEASVLQIVKKQGILRDIKQNGWRKENITAADAP